MNINEMAVGNNLGNISNKNINYTDKRLPSKTMAMCLVGFIFVLILIPGFPYHLSLFLFWAIFAVISFFYPEIGLTFIAFTSSFAGLIRWKDHSDPLLAGFNTTNLTIYYFVITLRYLIGNANSSRITIPLGKQGYVSFFFAFFTCLVFIDLVSNWRGTIEFAMMMREYIMPLLLLPFAFLVLNNDSNKAMMVLLGLFSGAAVIALFNIVHYHFGLPLIDSQYVIVHGTESSYYTRSFLGIEMLPRFPHIYNKEIT